MRLLCLAQAKTLSKYGCMHFFAALVLVCVDVIDYFILTMSDTDTDSDCTICVTNNGDIANVAKDLGAISVSSEGTVDLNDFDSLSESDNNNGDVHIYNNNTFSNVLKPVVLHYVFVQFFIIIRYHTDL